MSKAGKIVIGADISFPPMEYYDSDDPVGFSIDLGAALADKLGVDYEFVDTSWSGIIPALQSQRIDMILSSMTDNLERQKAINFVDYLNVGSSLLVQTGNPHNLKSLDDMCGYTMAGQTGANASIIAHRQADKCKDDGRETLVVQDYPDQAQVILAISSGRADAAALDYTGAVGYVLQDDGKTLQVASEDQYDAAPYGIGFNKADTDLMNAVQEALKELIDDGTYASLLDKWSISAASLTTATINGGTA